MSASAPDSVPGRSAGDAQGATKRLEACLPAIDQLKKLHESSSFSVIMALIARVLDLGTTGPVR